MVVLYDEKHAKHIDVFWVQINFVFMILKKLEWWIQFVASSWNVTYSV